MNQNRVPAGVRSGGQFAADERTVPALSLGVAHDDATDPHPDGESGASEIRREFGSDGQLLGETNLVLGVAADWPDGTPAAVRYHPDGSIESWRRADASERTYFPPGGALSHVDPRDGSHVVTAGDDGGRWIRRGVVARRESWVVPPVGPNGTWQANVPRFEELRDGPGGEPAVSYVRPDGSVSSATRYAGGGWTHTVDYFPDGQVAVVFSNSENPVVRGFPARDPVWKDIGMDGEQWQGIQPNDALHFADAGVTPEEAQTWSRDRTGMDAPTALKWRRQGYSPDRAAAEMAARRASSGRVSRS
ncbi:hypothetical protein Namu_2711 [Nakamurella multipartita DSM 44233]|uniref:Uncharacterized protein n=2 Tax=Nakamurella TaxID=53460 RepID=C8X8K2_NAKMY|nr:hypothetical protein Namu_2711 [Nakamurella multipartita DSM 44233]